MKTAWPTTLFLICSICFASQQVSSQHRPADSLQRKLDHIQQNAKSAKPDRTPTIMTEEEINDYFASGRASLPQGVEKVAFQGQSGVVTTFATVDFDEIRAGQNATNPLLTVFTGVHNVRIEADCAGASGKGKVHVRRITLDEVEIPRATLEFFVYKYVAPQYPNLGLDSEFPMPDKIDLATVGYQKLTVTQK